MIRPTLRCGSCVEIFENNLILKKMRLNTATCKISFIFKSESKSTSTYIWRGKHTLLVVEHYISVIDHNMPQHLQPANGLQQSSKFKSIFTKPQASLSSVRHTTYINISAFYKLTYRLSLSFLTKISLRHLSLLRTTASQILYN